MSCVCVVGEMERTVCEGKWEVPRCNRCWPATPDPQPVPCTTLTGCAQLAAPLCAPQVSLLRRLFKAALGEEAARMVDINTIDGFQVGGWRQACTRSPGQLRRERSRPCRLPAHCAPWPYQGLHQAPPPPLQGREKDVAFFSTVRSRRGPRGIGFVADERRINVGLTRARCERVYVCVTVCACANCRRGPHLVRPRPALLRPSVQAARLLAPAAICPTGLPPDPTAPLTHTTGRPPLPPPPRNPAGPPWSWWGTWSLWRPTRAGRRWCRTPASTSACTAQVCGWRGCEGN